MHGIELARAHSAQVVEPLVERALGGLRLATARLGSGSDVLSLDDTISRDHDWGLRLTLLVDDEVASAVASVLERLLPPEFEGHPTRFATTWDPVVRQRVEVASPLSFTRSRTGLDLSSAPDTVGWLSVTGQAVLEVTAGPVFRDDSGELTDIRERLAWYPDDVHRFAVAADWARLAQELPFVGRTGQAGDEVGSRIIAARLARTLMHLGFLLERRWPPYSKWLGTCFASLPRAGGVGEALQGDVGLPTVQPATEPFWDRPFRGVRDIAGTVRATITEGMLSRARPDGTVEQLTDDVGVLMDPDARAAIVTALVRR